MGQGQAPGTPVLLPGLISGWVWVGGPAWASGPHHGEHNNACAPGALWGLTGTIWTKPLHCFGLTRGTSYLPAFKKLSSTTSTFFTSTLGIGRCSLHFLEKKTKAQGVCDSPKGTKLETCEAGVRAQGSVTGECCPHHRAPGPPQAQGPDGCPPQATGLSGLQNSVSFVPVPCGFSPES